MPHAFRPPCLSAGVFVGARSTWGRVPVQSAYENTQTLASLGPLAARWSVGGGPAVADRRIVNETNWRDTTGRVLSAHDGFVGRFGGASCWYGSSSKQLAHRLQFSDFGLKTSFLAGQNRVFSWAGNARTVRI